MEDLYTVPPDFKYSPPIWRDFSLRTMTYFCVMCYPAFMILKTDMSLPIKLFLVVPIVAAAWMIARYEKYGQGLDRMIFNWFYFKISPSSYRLFSKEKKVSSTKDLVPLKEVKASTLELSCGTSVKILRVSSLNFGLLSEQEKRSIQKQFRAMCHTLSRGFPLQIFMRSRKVTEEEIVKGLQSLSRGGGFKKAKESYSRFLRSLAEGGEVHQKEFYIVISYNIYSLPAEINSIFDYLKTAKSIAIKKQKEIKYKDAEEQLRMREDMVRSGLKKCGLEVECLDRESMVQLLYECFNPDIGGDLSRRQDIKKYVASGLAGDNLTEIIAPTSVDIYPDHIRIGSLYLRFLVTMDWPPSLWGGWMQGINDLADDMDISIHICPRDMAADLRQISAQIRKMHGATVADRISNRADDHLTLVKKEKTEKLMRKFASGDEKLFDFICLLAIKAYSLEELDEKSAGVISKIAAREITIDVPKHQLKDAFLSYVPLGMMSMPFTRGFTSSLIGASFPLTSEDMSAGGGILYGLSEDGSSLIMLDRFSSAQPNHSMAVVGMSGMGKSFFCKAEIARQLACGVQCVCIDVEREYKDMCRALGGQYIAFSPRSEHAINPLARSFRLEDSSISGVDNMVRENMLFLKLVMADAKMEYQPLEAEDLLYEVYRRYDKPLLADLRHTAKEMGLDNIYHALRPWTEGTLRGLFDRETNVDLESPFLVFDLSNLKREHRGLAIQVIDGWFWKVIKNDRRRRIYQVDEASWLLRDFECAEAFEQLARRGRKYGVGFTIIDQQLDQLFSNEKSRAIVSNCAVKAIFGMDKGIVDNFVSTAINLTEKEQEMISTLTKGECILRAGMQRAMCRVVASEEETKIFSTSLSEAV